MKTKRKTHCINGHEFSPANSIVQTNNAGHLFQRCLLCRRECEARYRARRKALAKAGAPGIKIRLRFPYTKRKPKSVCKNGHSYDDAQNVIVHADGSRECRACAVQWRRQYRARQKALKAAERPGVKVDLVALAD